MIPADDTDPAALWLHFLDILAQYFPIEWARPRYTYEASPPDEQVRLPFVVWRFKQAVDEARVAALIQIITNAVVNFDGEVKWTLTRPNRNYVLHTQYAEDAWESGRYRMDVEMYTHLAEIHPEWGIQANKELPRLIDHIISQIEQRFEKA